jgi:hypothetical protein
MDDRFLTLELLAIPAVLGLGVLLHFLFDWSGQRRLVAVVAPVNESLWEHVKMAYWPLILVTAVEFAVLEPMPPGLLLAKAFGFYAMAALMVGLCLLGTVVLPNPRLPVRLAIDLLIFVVAVAAGQFVNYQLVLRVGPVLNNDLLGAALLILPGVTLAITSFRPPLAGLFRDPFNGSYGIPN